MSWWVLTDPEKTGTCERCKRPAAEHTWECGICRKIPRLMPKAILGTGDTMAFRQHTYADHPAGAYGGVTLCYCPRSAYMPAAPPPTVPAQPAVAAPAQPRPAAPAAQKPPRPPSGEACDCGGCGGCTAVSECFRPPEPGAGGRCIVCAFMGAAVAPVAPVAPKVEEPKASAEVVDAALEEASPDFQI
jgi:hypothetical protein